MQKIINFLMFSGNAEEAMGFYISLFPNSEIVSVAYYKTNEAGAEGTIMHATFSLNGQLFMCIDSAVQHAFTFTPAMSLYINCESETEVENLYNKLTDNGSVLMPLDTYPFSKKYAWITDKFNVSWQLSYTN